MKLLFNRLIQELDANGSPYSGAKLFTYESGTSTKEATYQDSAGSTPHANPIVLDSAGRVPAAVWGTEGQAYKLVLAPANDTDPPASPIWSIDSVSGINDVANVLSQWLATGITPTYISATSFSVPGDQTTEFHAGRRVKVVDSGGTKYGTILTSAFTTLTTLTVALDSGSLASPLTSVALGLQSAINTSVPVTDDSHKNMNCRLTLTSGSPITTGDVTAAETIYLTPFRGNTIWLYNGAFWRPHRLTEISADVPDATQMNDVFVYNNAGTLALDVVAWTNDTTRATALTTQDGVLVKSGATGRRYVGSFYSTTAGNGQTEDSLANRYLWNYYNRVLKAMKVLEATDSWNYSTAALRQANGSTANQLNMAIGVSEDIVEALVQGQVVSSGATFRTSFVGIGVDSTTVDSSLVRQRALVSSTVLDSPTAIYKGYPGIGKHFLAWLEYGGGADTQTWSGDTPSPEAQTGIVGSLWC